MAPRKRTKKEKEPTIPGLALLPADLQAAYTEFTKAHGEGVCVPPRTLPKNNVIPTGCFLMDLAMLGGWPEAYVGMVYGYHSTSKTTLLLNSVREFQRKHPKSWVVWVDSEDLYDEEWAKIIGVDVDRIFPMKPSFGEMAVDMVEDAIGRPSVGLVILDSIPACASLAILDKSAEDDTMAQLARLMGKLCSKVTTACSKERRAGHKVTVWLVNQLRDKVGFNMGSPRHLPGGRQINHIPKTKLWLKLVKEHETKDSRDNDTADYNEQGFKLEKTKLGSSFTEGRFDLNRNPDNPYVREGCIDDVDTIVTFAKKFGFITGGGGHFKLLTERRKFIVNSRAGTRKPKPLTVFSKLDDIKQLLREDQEERDTLARSIIVEQRVLKKRSPLPPDGYLVSPTGRLVRLQETED